MGVPVEMLPLLVAIETLPDISRTIGNVMGDMAATAFLGRDREEGAR
jgi:L-cystine uptake protein TcyP (sodium:dicarboxylate symporter family)